MNHGGVRMSRPVCPTRSTLAPGPLARRMFWDQLEHLSESDPRGECRDGTRYLKHKAFCGLSDFVTSEMCMFRVLPEKRWSCCLRCSWYFPSPGSQQMPGGLRLCPQYPRDLAGLGWFSFPFPGVPFPVSPAVVGPGCPFWTCCVSPTAFFKNSLLPLCLSAP